MQRSSTICYELEPGMWPTNFINVTVVRPERSLGGVQFLLDLKFDSPAQADMSIFDGGSTAICLRASLTQYSAEIVIDNIEARPIKRGQSFVLKTYFQLLELVPECQSILLNNIINPKATSIIDKARKFPDWIIPPESPRLH